MAIRFYCNHCGQLLGIASRKAGTEIECPKCGFAQTVPSEEAAAAAMAMANSARARGQVDETPQTAMYDDEATLMGAKRGPGSYPTVPVPPLVSDSAPPAGYEVARPMPPGTILYRRRTIYVHGILFLLLAGGAFAAGYFVGRGDAAVALRIARQKAAKQPVLVEGRLYYDTGAGKIAPDAGSVIIALPARRLPEDTLSIEGLRPRDPLPGPTSESIRKIEELGGAYERADDSGTFRIVLPGQGGYRVLLISRQTRRDRQTDIDELDLTGMARYFYRAADLVGPSKYRWTLREITADSPPIEHNFGRNGDE